MPTVILDETAAEELRHLAANSQERVRKKIRLLETTPDFGKRLHPSKYWSLRVGDYRVIYEIASTQEVRVLFIGHRKNVYDKFERHL